ncbi:21747_t:CDS:1, partial [Racocetra persica]
GKIDAHYYLRVGDVVTIISKERCESFAILRAIFRHKRDN